MRFEYAKDLLLSGYYQTKEVAIMSGFSDVKYFRTAFKKRYGVTVGEYLGNSANK
jgi:AraC-like DNA-binding protein